MIRPSGAIISYTQPFLTNRMSRQSKLLRGSWLVPLLNYEQKSHVTQTSWAHCLLMRHIDLNINISFNLIWYSVSGAPWGGFLLIHRIQWWECIRSVSCCHYNRELSPQIYYYTNIYAYILSYSYVDNYWDVIAFSNIKNLKITTDAKK